MLLYSITENGIDPKDFVPILKHLVKCGCTNWNLHKHGWVANYMVEKKPQGEVNLTVNVDIEAFDRKNFSWNLSTEHFGEMEKAHNKKVDNYLKELAELNRLLGIS